MKISIGPKPEVIVRPEIKARRPPDEYIDLLTKGELEFRKYISEIEESPIFERLMKEGYVRKVNFKGRIPPHIYQEFQDREFMEFLNKYNITSRPDWESDFFDRGAMRKIDGLSVKYKVPRGELRKAIQYCRELKLSRDGVEEVITSNISDPDKFHQLSAHQVSIQQEDLLFELSERLEKYSISKEDFVEYFLSGSAESFDIARDLGIDINVIEDIIEIVEKIQMTNFPQVNVVEHHNASGRPAEVQAIAFIKRLKDPPRAEIQIDASQQYGFQYRIKDIDGNLGKEELILIDKLRMINQRRSLTVRTVGFIFEVQYPYFVSGNELYLKPLSQAQIAKEMGEHEATVSRILRNKHIETPEGILPLKFFCQSKRDVIERIIRIREPAEIKSGARSKPFSDAEITDILRKEYDTEISRRTVTYYRKKKGSPKFYARRRSLLDQDRCGDNPADPLLLRDRP